jgi:hypothetical protein
MIFGVVVGVHVWSVSKRALRLLMILFSVALCTKLLVSVLLGLDWAYGKPDVAFKLAGEMIGLFMLILWISYFHMSARVKATFGTNL